MGSCTCINCSNICISTTFSTKISSHNFVTAADGGNVANKFSSSWICGFCDDDVVDSSFDDSRWIGAGFDTSSTTFGFDLSGDDDVVVDSSLDVFADEEGETVAVDSFDADVAATSVNDLRD